jgi:dolichol kinase
LLLSYGVGQANSKISQHVVLCLIAADGMAAVIGKKIGTHKIYGDKTLEGSLAFILTFLASYSMINK